MAASGKKKKTGSTAATTAAPGAETKAKADASQKNPRLALLAWFRENNITFNPSAMTINYDISTGSFNVTANKYALRVDDVIAKIPKIACLSAKNCAIADLIDAEGITGTLALTLALLHERYVVNSSPWSTYLSILPPNAPTPLFYSQETLSSLTPTDVPATLFEQHLADDFRMLALPFIHTHSTVFPADRTDDAWRRDFYACMSLVTSRAFAIDAWHGDAMVPLADLFNHKSGAENIHIAGEGDVCGFCGAVEGGCDCFWSDDEDENGEGNAGGGGAAGKIGRQLDMEVVDELTEAELKSMGVKDLKKILTELGEDANGCLYKEEIVGKILQQYPSKVKGNTDGIENDSSDNDSEDGWEDDDNNEKEDGSWLFNIEEEIPDLIDTAPTITTSSGKKTKKQQPSKQQRRQNVAIAEEENEEEEDSLDVTIVRGVKPNAEIFNIYGDHTNAKLLNLYGFAEVSNPNNNVQVDYNYLLDALKSSVGEKQVSERYEFWRHVGRKVVDYAIYGQDNDDDDWDDDESDNFSSNNNSDSENAERGRHQHSEECSHDHHQYNNSSSRLIKKTQQKDRDADAPQFNFDNAGRASKQLIAFLHLILLDSKAFNVLVNDEETVKKYILQLVENGLDSWTTATRTDSDPDVIGKKKAARNKGNAINAVKSTEKPVVKQIQAVLHDAASQRLKRYQGSYQGTELKELEELIVSVNFC
ncbi:hypothetical protein HK100_003486 [Physocladia obscura]|uniref:ARMET C-terminal domain-containing protein n=1 Tax=Physocladia obscura TaxID=109957 RepID=A0AAD5XAF5_9FUNG|nr:hypothetical protein HK100_003486 [Physocladia obscura]